MVCFHVHFSSTELIRPDVPRAVHRTLSHVCILLRHTGFLRIQCTSDRALVNCGASCSQTIVAASIRLVADELRIHFQGTYGSTLTSGIALEENFVISRSVSEEQITRRTNCVGRWNCNRECRNCSYRKRYYLMIVE